MTVRELIVQLSELNLDHQVAVSVYVQGEYVTAPIIEAATTALLSGGEVIDEYVLLEYE